MVTDESQVVDPLQGVQVVQFVVFRRIKSFVNNLHQSLFGLFIDEPFLGVKVCRYENLHLEW